MSTDAPTGVVGGSDPFPPLKLDAAAVEAILDDAFDPAARRNYGEIAFIRPGHARLQLDPGPETLRPGNIVSGPTIMGMADVAAYALILAQCGELRMAVTHTMNVNFYRGCPRQRLFADARMMKLGRRLATIDVRFWQDDETRLIAQASAGYILPD